MIGRRRCLGGFIPVRSYKRSYTAYSVDSLFAHSGLLHPFIHLGFAIEFNQPAILAEALAETAIHEDYIAPLYLVPAEKAAGGVGKRGEKTLLQILDEIHADKKLASSAHWSDRNKFKDGVMTRAPDEMIKYASQFTISGDQLEEKNAELVNLAGENQSFPL